MKLSIVCNGAVVDCFAPLERMPVLSPPVLFSNFFFAYPDIFLMTSKHMLSQAYVFVYEAIHVPYYP